MTLAELFLRQHYFKSSKQPIAILNLLSDEGHHEMEFNTSVQSTSAKIFHKKGITLINSLVLNQILFQLYGKRKGYKKNDKLATFLFFQLEKSNLKKFRFSPLSSSPAWEAQHYINVSAKT